MSPFRGVKRWLRRRWRRINAGVKRSVFASGFTLLHLAVFLTPFGARSENWLMDRWFGMRGQLPPPEDVIIVAIDEKTYRQLGLSSLEPLPREVHARLLELLGDFRAQKVVFDISFNSEGAKPESDLAFAKALKLVPTFIGQYLKRTIRNGPDGRVLSEEEWIKPLPLLAASATGTPAINLAIEDRIVRRFFLYEEQGRLRTPMASIVCHDEVTCPSEPTLGDYINYYGPAGTIKSISLSDVINGDPEHLARYFLGKIVLIGSKSLTQVGIEHKDAFLTPFPETLISGVEIHATVVGNVMEQKWLQRLNPRIEFTCLSAFAFLTAFMVISLAPLQSEIVLSSLAIGLAVTSYALFIAGTFFPGALLLCLFMPGLFLISTFYYFVIFQRSHKQMESALGVKLHVK